MLDARVGQTNYCVAILSRESRQMQKYVSPPVFASFHAIAIFALALTYSSSYALAQSTPPSQPAARRNEQLTSAAWKALDKEDFQGAVEKAQKCIETFEANATKRQKELEASQARVPNGEVAEHEKKAVNRNGLLNDVATCYFIKGRALEKMKQRDASVAAYKAAAKFTYGRAWDPEGPWFWSPAEAAAERLEELR